jgi:hypothetical protein
MRRVIVLAVVVGAVLVTAGAAQAGCWATVGLQPLPRGVTAGETWPVTVTVRQHGLTPLAGATPTITVTNAETGARTTADARPSGTVGTYRADVVIPQAGTWRVAVDDGFPVAECAQTHTFGSFTIGPSGGGSGGGMPWWPIALGAGLAAATLLALSLARLRVSGSRRLAAR